MNTRLTEIKIQNNFKCITSKMRKRTTASSARFCFRNVSLTSDNGVICNKFVTHF